MRQTSTGLRLSPSDLSNHLGCSHLTQLDLMVEQGRLDPPQWLDPSLKILQQRGLEFEDLYLKDIQQGGAKVDVPGNEGGLSGIDRTIASMKKGADYIYQADLEMEHWYGKADFLKKVPGKSDLGDWRYEIIDTKLARNTRAGTIVQLCVYAQAVEKIQGVIPEHIIVVSPGHEGFVEKVYRTLDFMAYHRLIQKQFEHQIESKPYTYPEPVPQCDICKWWSLCDKRRRADDHLSFVAGITRTQRAELNSKGIDTLHHLASMPIPLEWKPSRGVKESYEKIREQARIQVESRQKSRLLYEILPLEPPVFDESVKDVVTKGLFRLPEPSPGDIFLDFEGDPFIGTSGLEYLFGWMELNHDAPTYHHQWALHPEEEKKSFEYFIDLVFERLTIYPDLHIYHFGHYEITALKRMMGKYASREVEIDWLLRGQRFVDLHGILKQAVRAGVEAYSLKNFEPLFKYSRKTDLRNAALAKRSLEFCLELNVPQEIPEEDKHTTLSYNQEDCEAAFALRQWLETIRKELIGKGNEISRPVLKDGSAGDVKKARDEQLQALYERLTHDVPAEINDRSPDQQAKWLLANMLEYHWREEKSGWWEYFDLLKRPIEEFEKAKTAIGPLLFHGRFEIHENHVVNEYRFEAQDTDIRKGDSLYDQAQRKIGSVTNIDAQAGILTLQQPLQYKDEHPDGLICKPKQYDTTHAKPGAIRQLAMWVAEHGFDEIGPYRAVRDILLQKSPRPDDQKISVIENEAVRAVDWSKGLDNSFLAIQGPPGAGKTYTGAQIITALVKDGKTVGVTANSHKVIDTLLEEVIKQSGGQMEFICGHKVSAKEDITIDGIVPYTSNDTARGHLQKGKVHVLGGTPIMWANQKFFESVDYLIVDEAGQLSLADTIAAGQAAKNIILLGDPQQLKQPQQGSHPEGTEVSALEHILGAHQTIPKEKGIFLDNTRRMHPSVCAYISELFYENKLYAFAGLERQVISGDTRYQGAGLWLEPVEHHGNQNHSIEEVNRVKAIISELCSGRVFWTNKEGKQKALTHNDILVIAPYNAQVGKLKEALPESIQVGTVDKFQGREAPVVIYSMSTSSPEDAPRGMEFLYNPNRLNVAISRAKTAAIMVASPKLFSPECRTPDQMRMANGVCRYRELTI